MVASVQEYEKIDPIATVNCGDKTLRYAVPNQSTLWRVHTLFGKEPDTITWINSFQPDEVLLDVGANVGMYTVFAAVTRSARVFAFEPEASNFHLLNRNILLNQIQSRVRAFPIALSDHSGFGNLYLSEPGAGGSCHNFGDERDFRQQPFRSPYAQGSYSCTIDELIAQGVTPTPAHIKIDVDGIEEKVIAGARRTLCDTRLRSVLIEINSNLASHQTIVNEMITFDFRYNEEQVLQARRTEGPFKGIGNYVFRR